MADTVSRQKKANKLVKFFKETKAEMKKVTWPTREQLVHNTLIILIFIIITCIILSLCDGVFSWLLTQFTKIF